MLKRGVFLIIFACCSLGLCQSAPNTPPVSQTNIPAIAPANTPQAVSAVPIAPTQTSRISETLIGLISGLVSGIVVIFLNELLRRRNRVENYSTSVFEKRLNLYETLFEYVSNYSQVAEEVIRNDQLTKEQKLELVSEALHTVAGFCDKHQLYLDDELALHCCTVMMGLEDTKNCDDKEEILKQFHKDLLSTK
jgi:hypothetical protein